MTKIRVPSNQFYQDVADLKQRYGKQTRPQPRPNESSGGERRWYWAKLTSALTAGSLEAPTTFTFDVWLPDATSTDDPVPFVRTSNTAQRDMTGVNRFALEAVTGKTIQVEFNHNEYTLKGLDC